MTDTLRLGSLLVLLAGAACGIDPLELEDAEDQLGGVAEGREIYATVRPRAIFLNRSGGQFTPGPEDATANTSRVLDYFGRGPTTLPAYLPQPGEWTAVVGCLRKAFAPYAMAVVEAEPAAPHLEVVVTGATAAAVGDHPGVGGLAWPTLQPVSGIVFVFGKQYPFSGLQGSARHRRLCAMILHEAGHALGLSHALSCKSVLYPRFSAFCGDRVEYRDESLACGELMAGSYAAVPRQCPGGLSTRNEHQYLLQALGAAGPLSQPAPTCAQHCGSSAPVPGSSPACYCDAVCVEKRDCCQDHTTRCKQP